MVILLSILGSIFSSICYHAGGLDQTEPYWIPKWMRQSWVRDWICPFFCLLPLFIQHPSWWFVPAYGLMGAAFSAYWKYKGNTNFWVSGLFVGLAAFPLLFCGFVWWLLLCRAIFIALWWGFWSAVIGNDHIEEHGRGFFPGIAALIA